MIRHVVLFKFKEGAPKAENIADVKKMLLALPPVIADIRHMEVGLDVLSTASSYDMALLVDVDDLSALKRYKNHPEHQKVLAVILKATESRISVDYEI